MRINADLQTFLLWALKAIPQMRGVSHQKHPRRGALLHLDNGDTAVRNLKAEKTRERRAESIAQQHLDHRIVRGQQHVALVPFRRRLHRGDGAAQDILKILSAGAGHRHRLR